MIVLIVGLYYVDHGLTLPQYPFPFVLALVFELAAGLMLSRPVEWNALMKARPTPWNDDIERWKMDLEKNRARTLRKWIGFFLCYGVIEFMGCCLVLTIWAWARL